MNTKQITLIVLAVAIISIAALPTTKAQAAPISTAAPITQTVTVTASEDETTAPRIVNASQSNGSKASMFTPAAEVRKIKHTDNSTAPAVECMEDQPCWNCSTMGNGICGPVVVPPATNE